VPADAWVWRSGWSEWKPGGEAGALAASATPRPSSTPLTAANAPSPPPLSANDDFAALLPHEIGDPLSALGRPVDALRAARRRRQQINQRLVIAMSVLAIALLAILLVVLNR
jgi:hypothetical protein